MPREDSKVPYLTALLAPIAGNSPTFSTAKRPSPDAASCPNLSELPCVHGLSVREQIANNAGNSLVNWQPIATFFTTECATPDAWLTTEDGHIQLGYYDEDECCWRATANDMQFIPTGWIPVAEYEAKQA